jgi:hypothetical protein
MGHMTIRFLISTFPIFQGVNSASYFSFMVFIDSFLQKNISVLSKCSAVIGVPDHRALRKNGASVF